MALYFYSDPHLSHRNLVEKFTVMGPDGTERKARPFATVEAHDAFLLDTYHATITADDVVWWLGDICFKPTNSLIERIAALPGTRHLILGNHDRETTTLYHRMGFTKIRSSWRPWKGVLVTHIPVHERSLPHGGVNVHGHTHSVCYGHPYINVCVEQTGYAPISEAALRKLINAQQ